LLERWSASEKHPPPAPAPAQTGGGDGDAASEYWLPEWAADAEGAGPGVYDLHRRNITLFFSGVIGWAVQVDPMNHTLKAPSIERLNLKYDETLSIVDFESNLRRYTSAAWMATRSHRWRQRKTTMTGG